MNIPSPRDLCARPGSARLHDAIAPAAPAFESLEPRRFLSAGDLDTTFGRRGVVVNRHRTEAVGIALQTVYPGVMQFVVADQHAVSRFNADGSPDPTFGIKGRAGGNRHAGWLIARVAVQADGKILVLAQTAGPWYSRTWFIARLAADGTTDATFGPNHDGRVAIVGVPGHPGFDPRSMAVAPDGKIVVGGADRVEDAGSFSVSRPAVIRFNADGTRDTSFGIGGIAVDHPVSPGQASPGVWGTGAMTVLSDGAVLLAGCYAFWVPGHQATVTFAPDGQTSTYRDLGSPAGTYVDVARRPDDTLALLGFSFPAGDTLSLDGGATSSPLPRNSWEAGSNTFVRGLAIAPNGKSYVTASGDNQAEIYRVNADGSLDDTWGLGGAVVLGSDPFHKRPLADVSIAGLLVLPVASGSVVVAGASGGHLMLARLQGSGGTPRDDPPAMFDALIRGVSYPTAEPVNLRVVFAGSQPIRADSLDNSDVVVTGPRGFTGYATLVPPTDPNAQSPTDTLLLGSYQLAAPGGKWDPTDNGTYTFHLQPNQVSDIAGGVVPGGVIGTVHVNIPWPDVDAVKTRLADTRLRTSGGRRVVSLTVEYALAGSAHAPRRGIIVPHTLDNDDLTVTAPTGDVLHPRLTAVSGHPDGTYWLATYALELPDGPPNSLAPPPPDGSYAVRGAAVLTRAGHTLSGRVIGTFNLRAGRVATP